MNITKKFLKENDACDLGMEWFVKKDETNSINDEKMPEGINLEFLCSMLLKENHFAWANWLLVRLFTREQKIQYAIFAAEQVIDIFEKKCPKDDRPRKAIEAAKSYLKFPTQENKNTAAAAAYAAAAYDAAAAYADATTAAAATAAAAYAADAAADMKTRIILYGLEILK
jgi:hypothetical protein